MNGSIRLAMVAIALGMSGCMTLDNEPNEPAELISSENPTGSFPLGTIASQYPRDIGIEKHPDVVFIENFEFSSVAQVFSRWTHVKNGSGMALEFDTPSLSGGRYSIRMLRGDTGGHLWKRLDRGSAASLANDDVLYLRYYIKLSNFGAHHHTGGGMEGITHSDNWPIGTAGIRPTGTDRFSTRVEAFNDGRDRVDFYSYWMGMHHNATLPEYYGNSFIHNYGAKHQRNGWTCIEFMLKLNNPVSASNGELRLWVNDVEVGHLRQGAPSGKYLHDQFLPEGSDGLAWYQQNYPWSMGQVAMAPFEGFRWRSTENLKLNAISLQYYATKPYQGTEVDPERVWFDDMVLAKSRIGCIQ